MYRYSINHFEVPVGKSCPGSSNDPNIKFPSYGPTLKFLQGDENSCIICLLASTLYEFGYIYASNYVYQRLKDGG